jgi:signal transduction histidine kinase
VNHILADATGRIWYAVSGRGIGQLSSPGDESFHDLGASPWGGQVRVMTQHSDGTLWFGTDNGFGRIRDDDLEGWPVPEIFSGAAVSDIHVDHDGVLWIGTERGGLVRIEGASRDLAVDLAGLEVQPVRRVLSDGSGSLWVLSALGLGVVSHEQLRERIERPRGENWFPFFNRLVDSAPVPHEDAVGGWRTRDAHLWFVDRDAVIVVDPRTFPFNTVEPPVAIVGVLVDGEELPGRDTFITPTHPTRISVAYQALSFAGHVAFRHRLEGHDEGWVEAGPSLDAEYLDLPAGEYTFRVVARNGEDYVWNKEGAAVRIVVPPAWWQRAWVIVGFLLAAAFVSTSAMYRGLRTTRRRTALLEKEVEARRTAESELRLLGRQMVDAQEDDRARIARELHDDINQRLAAASIDAELSARAMGTDPAAAASQLRELQERLDAISGDIRKISHELHPDTLRQLGFVVTLESLLDEFESRTSVSVVQSLPEPAEKIPDDVALCLYRVTQEILRNVSAHAEASLVELEVSVSRGSATLRIADDGVGFDPEKRPPGLGLASIRERARLLGGSVALDTRPDAGTELVIEIPIPGLP